MEESQNRFTKNYYGEENIRTIMDLTELVVCGMKKEKMEEKIPKLADFFEDAKGK